jgi:hypothetical protein
MLGDGSGWEPAEEVPGGDCLSINSFCSAAAGRVLAYKAASNWASLAMLVAAQPLGSGQATWGVKVKVGKTRGE